MWTPGGGEWRRHEARGRHRQMTLTDANGDDRSPALSRAASARLVIGIVVFVAAGVVAILGLRPVAHWTVAAMTERMGLEGLGVDPEEGQVLPGGLVGATEASSVDLVLGTRLHVALESNTRVVLGRAPGRWFRRTADIQLQKGTLRVTTGGGGGHVRVRVVAPGATTQTERATFSVAASGDTTCISVGAGEVHVSATIGAAGAGSSAAVTIPAGRRACYDAAGHAGSVGEIEPAERDSLAQFASEQLTATPAE